MTEDFELVDAPTQTKHQKVEIFLACDTTGSMTPHISRMTSVMTAVLEYLNGLVDSGEVDGLDLTFYLVGLNDWLTGENATPPAKLFLKEEESIAAGKPVGFTFTLNKNDLTTTKTALKTVIDAIAHMAAQIRTSGHNGGDAREVQQLPKSSP